MPQRPGFEPPKPSNTPSTGVEDAQIARDDTSRAAAAAQAAKNEAEDAARAIYRAAFFDGEWEALIRDVEAHLTAARSDAEAAEEFAMQALEAQSAAAAAAQAVRAAEQASAAARAVAEQAGATRGADAYWEMRSKAQLPARFYADLSADGAVVTAMSHPQLRHRCCPCRRGGCLVCGSHRR